LPSPGVLYAILVGRFAETFFKAFDKIADIVKAAIECDIQNGTLGRPKQFAGFV
jgi:hypothetical protein